MDDDIRSADACLKLCCETNECDVFIYEEKVNRLWNRIESKAGRFEWIMKIVCLVIQTKIYFTFVDDVIQSDWTFFLFAREQFQFVALDLNKFNRLINEINSDIYLKSRFSSELWTDSGSMTPSSFLFFFFQNLGSCFLFHCGLPDDFRCKFTSHSNYTSGVLTVPRRELDTPTIVTPVAIVQPKLSQNELELVNLKRPSNAYHL